MDLGLIVGIITVSFVIGVVLVSLFTIYRVIRHPQKPNERSVPSRPWRATTKIGCLAGLAVYLFAILLILVITPWERMGEGAWLLVVCLLALFVLGLVAGAIMLVIAIARAFFRRVPRGPDGNGPPEV